MSEKRTPDRWNALFILAVFVVGAFCLAMLWGLI